jgi:hypothetical protein
MQPNAEWKIRPTVIYTPLLDFTGDIGSLQVLLFCQIDILVTDFFSTVLS